VCEAVLAEIFEGMDDSGTLARDRVLTLVQRFLNSRSVTWAVRAEDVLNKVGLTSLDSVRLVLLVEDEFDVTIPIKEITPANFQSISSIARLVDKLRK
jgi:acyl carrier protein